MALKLLTILVLTAAVASPAAAQERAGRRRADPNAAGSQEPQARQTERTSRERAVPRETPRAAPPEPRELRRDDRDVRPSPAQPEVRRDAGRSDRNDYRRGNDGRYDSRYYGRAVPRRYPPRVVSPVVVRVIPYRPYVYRPSYRAGVVYGTGGYYPYGYTPRSYYDPIPGRPYGGLRITGAPRYARVFADGYFVGLVNDFDGVFQHLNLEAGPHRIEIEDDGYGAIAFDVHIRPGQTITYRAGY